MSNENATWVEYYNRNEGDPLEYEGPAQFVTALISALSLPREFETRICLELGAGTGIRNAPLLKTLSQRGFLIDVSHQALSRGETLLGFSRVVCDAARISLPDRSVDVIIAADLFMHFRDWMPYLREVTRVLRRDGLFIFNWLGTKDCQVERVSKGPSGSLFLPAQVPVAFRTGHEGQHLVRRAGLRVARLEHTWRHDPPHPEFFEQPHTHDEWSLACFK